MTHVTSTRRQRSRRLATLATVITAFAIGLSCTEPTSPIVPTQRAAGTGRSSTAIPVLPDSMRSWSFSNDQTNTACTDTSVCRLVDGPGSAPMGTGSAELATNAATDGVALVLPGLGGTRLDHVTDLRYSTYRQSVDQGNNLAIALQLNVDYDLDDAMTGWQGRIVFEPYQGAGGTVLQGTWQAWDARAGKWWGTKASVPRNGVNVANPCVQATPCTWAQLLAAFPNVGVHSTYGAIVLKAGSGWASFRGNVDALTIAVDSVATTYDFERVPAAPTPGYRLQTTMQDGVVAPSWNVDTTYASGAQVTYSFASRPGRAEPIVVLDDTLVPASGQFIMTRDRAFQVFSDTVYSYETLQPLERAIADLERQLLFGSDKATAAETKVRFYLDQLSNGTDPAVLARAVKIAQYVASDPITDSAAIRATDAALTTFDIMINLYPDPTYPFDVYHVNEGDVTPSLQNAPSSTGGHLSLPSVGPSPTAIRRAARLRAMGRLPSGALIPSARGSASLRPSRNNALLPAERSSDISNYAEFPTEQLFVIYSNGVWNTKRDGDFSTSLIAARLGREERFNNWWTTVEQHHNRTWSEERAALDAGDTCAARALEDYLVLSDAHVYALYLTCKNPPIHSWARGLNDLLELMRMRKELINGTAPSNPDVLRLTRKIAERRNDWNAHVILVGHSEGTVLDAQAIRALPTLESHPVNVANRCVAALALAPLVSPDQFGVDEYHVKGLLANGDIATTLAGSGWTAFNVSKSDEFALANDFPTQFFLATGIHRVNESYLTGGGADLFTAKMTELHKECLPKSATLTLSTTTAAVGSALTGDAKAINQNGRELPGRIVTIGGPVLEQGVTGNLTAFYPSDTAQQVEARVTDFISAFAPITISVFDIPLTVARNTRMGWHFFAAANAPTGPSTFHPEPTAPPSNCTEHIKFTDTDGAWIEWAAYCETTYTPVFEPLAQIPGGLSVDDVRVTMTTAPGDAGAKRSGDTCIDDAPCISSAMVEFLHRMVNVDGTPRWDVIGRSAVVPAGG